MKKPIGKIVLAKNMIGWFDNINMIRLTLKNPEAIIYEGQNLTLINQACAAKKIQFIKFN